jgi:hypothetical protein
MSWLDIVSSALAGIHSQAMVARVILGNQKFVNTEAPRAIGRVRCFDCKAEIGGLRSFKCHNWAYAMPALRKVLGDKLDAPRRDIDASKIGAIAPRMAGRTHARGRSGRRRVRLRFDPVTESPASGCVD